MHRLTIIVATALVASFAIEAEAQRWTSRGDVAVAAHRFSDAMSRLERAMDYRPVDWRLEREVRQLSRMSERLHHAVERGADFGFLSDQFDRIQHQFYEVRSEMRYAMRGDRRLLRQWRRAAREFHQLEALMGRYDARDYVYPGDRYHDPYDRRDRYRYYERPAVPVRPDPPRQTYRWNWRWP
jgi:hypothetical protein